MKATGIVRRIDDLGRVVIPKEIRRTLRIREGDPLEIFLGWDGGIILKKYSWLNNVYEVSTGVISALKSSGFPQVVLYDRDVAVMGQPQSYGMPSEVPSLWYDYRMDGNVYAVEDGISILALNLDGESIGFIATKTEFVKKNTEEILRFAGRAIIRNLAE